ncbi:phosphoglycerate mutase-like protein [Patellaria atrata CBS 101060]|uniref:Phosphoglycerate mutase-like protein n=1 Tax=Patellaria atrata CBS 101060 TaxID=1346257 RepID=A0A9P4VWB1_9PEZI|nr:phosphoglycerate mutase-like protein [Patellaria atrata CBS 101060]
MLALFVAVIAAVWPTSVNSQAEDVNTRYTVLGSVIFTRTGERTPLINSPSTLTSLGAQQAYSAGSDFRNRYLEAINNGDGLRTISPVRGISTYSLDPDQIYVLTREDQYLIATAQAFLQGLYPPYTVDSNNTSPFLDPNSVLSNASYIESPLGGYQYPQIRAVTDLDPHSIFVAGDNNCSNYARSGSKYLSHPNFLETLQETANLYRGLGIATLSDVIPEAAWSYSNAYTIWDYLSFQYTHDSTTFNILSQNISFPGAYSQLRYLADQQQWALNGNLSASGSISGDQIRAVAGKTLAAKILGLLYTNIKTQGASNKLSLLFGEHEPFLSFFALSKLDQHSNLFTGIPEFGSSLVFDLFVMSPSEGSNEEDSDSPYPNEDDLMVRFYFKNGTAEGARVRQYPLFGRGRSEMDMPWRVFEAEMLSFALGSAGEWCNTCNSESVWCAAFNGSYVYDDPSPSSSYSGGGGMSPQEAGVIGAGVTLGVLALLVGLAMLIGGVRFHRVGRSKKHELGGFKGSQKLASDKDLVLPKGGAGITIEESKPKERVGSWELKGKEEEGHGRFGVLTPSTSGEEGLNPFETPVKPDERV